MRIGILADIHEAAAPLKAALRHFDRVGVEQVVVLGDVFETGEAIGETVELLRSIDFVGVWGNHDLGLSYKPGRALRKKYGAELIEFFGKLEGSVEVGGCLFTHGLPHWDPTDPMVFYLGGRVEEPETRAEVFEAYDRQTMFTGHFHRWLTSTPSGVSPWTGEAPLQLDRQGPSLTCIGPVMEGWCAVLDTSRWELTPARVADVRRCRPGED